MVLHVSIANSKFNRYHYQIAYKRGHRWRKKYKHSVLESKNEHLVVACTKANGALNLLFQPSTDVFPHTYSLGCNEPATALHPLTVLTEPVRSAIKQDETEYLSSDQSTFLRIQFRYNLSNPFLFQIMMYPFFCLYWWVD